MKQNHNSLLSDGALLLLFVICFVCIAFMQGDPNHYIQNVIFLNLAFFIAIVTYFTPVTTGLILNILFIFGFGTFTLYQTVSLGEVVGKASYFWLIMTPVITVVTWMLTHSTKLLQEENEQLKKRNVSLATLDENTSLRNNLSFQKDATVFMALSIRYKIPLTLLLISVRYWEDLSRMVSEVQMTEMINDVSKISEDSIRMNDSLYMLSTGNPIWGLVLFTDREGAEVVIKRLKEKVVAFNTVDFISGDLPSRSQKNYKVELTLITGLIEYHPETIATPLEFIAQAKKQMEYDV